MNAPQSHSSAPAPSDFTLHHALEKIIAGEDLSRREAEAAMERILSGQSNDAQIAGFLASLRMKGETVDEVVGFAKVMRQHAAPIFPHGRKFAASEPLTWVSTETSARRPESGASVATQTTGTSKRRLL